MNEHEEFQSMAVNLSDLTPSLSGKSGQVSSDHYELCRIAGTTDRTQGKKERIRLFKTYAARCALSVKSKYADMKDCYSASADLVEVLHCDGFPDARSVGCSVLVTNGAGPPLPFGEFKVREKPSHAVVLVAGCLIDATIGQFRITGLDFPDYYVFRNVLRLSV